MTGDDIARDAKGRPLYDRYGRPVHRRQYPKQQELDPRYYPNYGNQPQHNPSIDPRYCEQKPPVQRPVRKRKKATRRGCGCFGGLIILLLAVVALVVAGTVTVDSKLDRIVAFPPAAGRPAGGHGTNWLLVGSDSRKGLSPEEAAALGTGGDLGSSRTDTIMILHTGGAQPVLLSLPRDSYVDVPGYGKNKINASFAFGGAPLLIQTVEQATGLRIDHYTEVGFGGFAGIVDAVGGVDMCLEQPMVDTLAGINLQPGCQNLTGPEALGFVRSRNFPRGDLDRVIHQRDFLHALVKKATSPGVLANPFRIIPLVFKGAASLSVGENTHAWNLALLAWSLRGGVDQKTVPFGGLGMTDVGSVVYWDGPAATALFDSLK